MDNIFAIGVGLGLRAVIDLVTHHDLKLGGSLVGLWEGVVLHHFLAKFPSSFDPYVGFGFRLLVDLFFTESVTKMAIVVLWAGLGMLLTDLGVDLWTDRRFRRLTRRARHYLSSASLGFPSGRGPQRVQFMHISPSSTMRSPPVQTRSPLGSEVLSAPAPPTPAPPRINPRPVPGSFSDHLSETDTDASREQRPATPSELEYVTLPLPNLSDFNPDTVEVREDHFHDASGLTTPTNERPQIVVQAASPDQSGLTTPVNGTFSPREGLPPINIIHDNAEDHGSNRTPTMNPVDLSDPPPIPIPVRMPTADIDEAEEQADILFPTPQLIPDIPTPQPSPGLVPPVEFMSDMSETADLVSGEMQGNDDTIDPPPSYEQTPGETADETSHADANVVPDVSPDSNITGTQGLRKHADEEEAWLEVGHQEEAGYYDSLAALRARVQMHAAERQANLLNAKGDDQIYKKNNPKPDKQNIDVQGLNVDYANRKIEEALCETDGPQLRVFTGTGNKGKALRRSIFGYIQDTLHFDARYDDKHADVLWITLPPKPDNAGPSTSFTA